MDAVTRKRIAKGIKRYHRNKKKAEAEAKKLGIEPGGQLIPREAVPPMSRPSGPKSGPKPRKSVGNGLGSTKELNVEALGQLIASVVRNLSNG